ncbi:MAG: hypothetical protein GY765_10760, partial [bacterium]|nr:hypothetical protein [bacterium]
YLGQFDNAGSQKDTAFSFSPFSSGDAVSPRMERHNTLEINGLTTNGQLSLSFSYNRHEYKKSSIQKLADLYKDRLTRIISLCLSIEQVQPTPSDLDYPDLTIQRLEQVQQSVKALPTAGARIDNLYPLAPMQAGMLFHYLAAPDSGVYFEQSCITLNGRLETLNIQKSFQQLVDRYDIFRTLFFHEGTGEPIQVVLK